MYRDALVHSHNIAVRGGTERRDTLFPVHWWISKVLC